MDDHSIVNLYLRRDEAAIPTDVLDAYVTHVIEICLARGWLTESEVQRMLGASE